MAWSNVMFRWDAHARYQQTLPTLADGELGELQLDQRGRLRVAVEATVNPIAENSTRLIPTAAAASGQIAAAQANLLELVGHSETSTACYLMLFDQTGAPLNGATPKQKFRIPADCPLFSIDLRSKPASYTNGIRWAASSTAGTLTGVAVNLWFEAVYS